MNICIFEHCQKGRLDGIKKPLPSYEDMGPIALTRPVYALKVGMSTLGDKIERHYAQQRAVLFQMRPYLADVYKLGLGGPQRGNVNNFNKALEEGALFIDGAVLASDPSRLPEPDGNNLAGIVEEVYQREKTGEEKKRKRIVYARLNSGTVRRLADGGGFETFLENLYGAVYEDSIEDSMPTENAEVDFVTYPWDLIKRNGDEIVREFDLIKVPEFENCGDFSKLNIIGDGKIYIEEGANVWPGATFNVDDGGQIYIAKGADVWSSAVLNARNNGRIYISKNTKLKGHVALDAEGGKVYVGENSLIEGGVHLNAVKTRIYIGNYVYVTPPTTIEGPFFAANNTGIGRQKTSIDGAKIRADCSIGPVCNVAGELEESIIHGFSNKHHDGFMGHAYVGEWCNWGAGTKNSDLKNDYGQVDVILRMIQRGRREFVPFSVGSGENKKVGIYMGDHTKTALSSLFNTGTIVGIMSNVVSGSLSEKYIPSFCIYLNGKMSGRPKLATISAEKPIMSRRGVEMTQEYEEMLLRVHEMTEAERRTLVKKSRRKMAVLK